MPYRMIRATHLVEDLDSGQATWTQVDQAVERVVATRARFAELVDRPAPDRSVLASPAHRALAREAAAKSVVLLRNEPVDGAPVLPLSLSPGSTVALFGSLATAVNLGDGGSSDVWAPEVVTTAQGLEAALPGVTVVHDDGADPARAAAVAGGADVAVVVVGYTRLDEGEYIGEFATAHLAHLFPGEDDPALAARFNDQIADERSTVPPAYAIPGVADGGFAEGGDRSSLRLHQGDIELIRSVAAANPRTVVVLVAGSAVVISEWDRSVPAVVQAWYSGMEGGHGVTDVLLGKVDASGRLPFSVPAEESDLPPFDAKAEAFVYDRWHGYWHLARRGIAPAYPFGFGLSYTSFALESAVAEVDGDVVRVAASVRNTGPRSGTDVLQVYVVREGSDRPERLAGFRRFGVGAGDVAHVEVEVALGTLAERDVDQHAMVIRPGTYVVRVAHHASDEGITIPVTLEAAQVGR
jgi:beta-glucosidase